MKKPFNFFHNVWKSASFMDRGKYELIKWINVWIQWDNSYFTGLWRGHMFWRVSELENSDCSLMNTVTLTQPHIKLHTLPVSGSPSSTHFHSMRQWNRHLSKSLRTPEAEDRREKLSVDDGDTLFKLHRHTHTRTHSYHSLFPPFSYLSCIIHHSPHSLYLLQSLLSLYNTDFSD